MRFFRKSAYEDDLSNLVESYRRDEHEPLLVWLACPAPSCGELYYAHGAITFIASPLPNPEERWIADNVREGKNLLKEIHPQHPGWLDPMSSGPKYGERAYG